MEEKRQLADGSVKEVMPADLEITLMTDFERYGNGRICAGIHMASFNHEGVSGSISAAGDVIGITVRENGKSRAWTVDVGDIVAAVLRADAQYLAHADEIAEKHPVYVP